jgi:membrane protease YdiL (CAAX protease family)
MDVLWRLIFCIALGLLVWLLHNKIGSYPKSWPASENPKSEFIEVALLWGNAVFIPILIFYLISPWLNRVVPDKTLQELIYVPLRSVPYVALPLLIVLRRNKWTAKDFGFSWKNQSRSVSVFAVATGLVIGLVPLVTGQSNIATEPLPAGVLLLLLYNNTFLEEFYHRGVIQSKLERAVGQRKAIGWGGLLFGLTHVVFDISMLWRTGGITTVFFAVLLQTIAGWLLGIIYMKTRSLWPGMACHYLGNWLPAVLAGLPA